MKRTRSRWPSLVFLPATLLEIIFVANGFAQTPISSPLANDIPSVSIVATDQYATWSGTPGIFTIQRAGNAAPSLYVYYEISGTATNGQDYETIGNWVSIPGGVLSGEVVINPIDHNRRRNRSVVLTLASSPLMGPVGGSMPVNYVIGSPNTATVYIVTGPMTNLPPMVAIASPTNNSIFYTPVNLPILVCAHDPDGSVRSVEFFANGTSLGISTDSVDLLPTVSGPMPPLQPMPPYMPFTLVWTNAPAGTNILLTALATDNDGATTLSVPVAITVKPGPSPSPTNVPPAIRIASPASGSTFKAPVDIPIVAYVSTPGSSVAHVEFFADTNFLGFGEPLAITPPLPPGPIQPPIMILSSNWYSLVWTNAQQGSHELVAEVIDSSAVSVVSAPVDITIMAPTPATNAPCTVRILAVEPIAVEGTNCWSWRGLAAAVPTWTNWSSSASVCCFFTNRGPKDAVFAVERTGSASNDLTVTYDIGGTASNGVDYAALPGTLTIPAGQSSAFITVVPLDDGTPDQNSTIILTLTTNANYALGFPSRAAALILDGSNPCPVPGMLPDGCFHVNAAGPNGAWFRIEYTTNILLGWQTLCTNQVIDGSIDFIDPDGPLSKTRFYRVVKEPNP